MKAYGGVDVLIHIFLTAALVGGEWSASRPGRFTSRERALGTHLTGGWVGPRAGLDEVEKGKFLILPGLQSRPLGCPAYSQSLYRLRYPGSTGLARLKINNQVINQCNRMRTDNIQNNTALVSLLTIQLRMNVER
jgi:hypothetical protein